MPCDHVSDIILDAKNAAVEDISPNPCPLGGYPGTRGGQHKLSRMLSMLEGEQESWGSWAKGNPTWHEPGPSVFIFQVN